MEAGWGNGCGVPAPRMGGGLVRHMSSTVEVQLLAMLQDAGVDDKVRRGG